MTNKERGLYAEQLVASYIQQQGYTLLERNYRKAYGEIDLVAQHNNIVAFIEVKMRYNPLFDISELITIAKQQKIDKVMRHFLATRQLYDTVIARCDVALVTIIDSGQPSIQYIENAFTFNH